MRPNENSSSSSGKDTLATIALAAARRQPHEPSFAELAAGLAGAGTADHQMPAKRYEFDGRFAACLDKALLIPDAAIAEAYRAISLRFPRLWVQGVLPGSRLASGCLFLQAEPTAPIRMLVVAEQSVEEWKYIGMKLPEAAYIKGASGIFEPPVMLGFGLRGAEWPSRSGDSLNLDEAIDYYRQFPEYAFSAHAKHYEAGVRKTFGKAAFFARALVLLHSQRLMQPGALLESEVERDARRREYGQIRRQAQVSRSVPLACAPLRYDIAAVKAFTEAQKPKRMLALLKRVEMRFGLSNPWIGKDGKLRINRKTGEPIRTRAHIRRVPVGDDYHDRQHRVTASRPVTLDLSNGYPALKPE